MSDSLIQRLSRFDRVNTAGYAMACVYPRYFGQAYQPPTLFMMPTFAKKIDASLNANIISDTDLITTLNNLTDPPNQWNGNTGVQNIITSYQSGLLLWIPQRGVDSCYRMGFVQKGLTCLNPFISGWDRAIFNNGIAPSFNNEYITSIIFTKTVALPYLGNQQINFAPDIEETFSKARLYTGDFRVKSNTTSIGNTALSGRLSAGVVTDTRDISQSQDQAYSINDLVQTSITAKDGLKEVSVQQGIITLLGPDARSDLGPPKSDFRSINNGSFSQVSLPRLFQYSLLATNTSGGDLRNFFPVQSYWISTVGAEITGSTAFAMNTRTKNVSLPPIDEGGCLTFEGNIVVVVENAGADLPIDATVSYSLMFSFSHYFAGLSTYGLTQFQVGKSDQFVRGVLGNDLSYHSIAINADASFDTKGMAITGKYVGTICTVGIRRNLTPSATAFPNLLINIRGKADDVDVSLNVTAKTVEEPGRTGPVHLIRWDNVTGGQSLNIEVFCLRKLFPKAVLLHLHSQMQRTLAMLQMLALFLMCLTCLISVLLFLVTGSLINTNVSNQMSEAKPWNSMLWNGLAKILT
jgi:hypothetical protein